MRNSQFKGRNIETSIDKLNRYFDNVFENVRNFDGAQAAVFRPENDISQFFCLVNGDGKLKAWGSPLSAFFSTTGPPGYPKPIILAVLSKASPGASSIVPPRRVKEDGPFTITNWQCPPDAINIK